MNEEQTTRLLRELRIIRVCAIVATTVFALTFIAHILGIRI